MLFKSNKKYDASEMNRVIENIGGDWNASTYWDSTILYAEVLSRNFNKLLDVMYHIIVNDYYREDEFEKEKQVVLTEIDKYQNDPVSKVYQLCPRAVFGDSDLGAPVFGSKETVEKIDVERVLEFKNRYFLANNMVVTIIGGFSGEDLESAVNLFNKIDEGEIVKKTPRRSNPMNIIEEMDVEDQCYICYSWELRKENIFEASMLEAILAMGSYNMLFEKLRQEKGIGYSFGVIQDYLGNIGYIGVVIEGLDCNRNREAILTLKGILSDLRENGVSEEIILGKKNYIRFIREKFRNFYGERAEDTVRRVLNGLELESIDFANELLKREWKEFNKAINDGYLSLITPKK